MVNGSFYSKSQKVDGSFYSKNRKVDGSFDSKSLMVDGSFGSKRVKVDGSFDSKCAKVNSCFGGSITKAESFSTKFEEYELGEYSSTEYEALCKQVDVEHGRVLQGDKQDDQTSTCVSGFVSRGDENSTSAGATKIRF